MSKKNKAKNIAQGNYAICVTMGLIVGFGLGAVMDNVLLATIVGGLVGTAVGYYFNHLKKNKKRH